MFSKQQPVVHKSNFLENNLAIASSITKLQSEVILTV